MATAAPMPYGWFVRNGAGKFLLAHKMTWHADRKDATRFATWEDGRDFLHRFYLAPPAGADNSLHLIDYAEHLPPQADAHVPYVRSAAEVREDAMIEDRAREAVRNAKWIMRPMLRGFGQ